MGGPVRFPQGAPLAEIPFNSGPKALSLLTKVETLRFPGGRPPLKRRRFFEFLNKKTKRLKSPFQCLSTVMVLEQLHPTPLFLRYLSQHGGVSSLFKKLLFYSPGRFTTAPSSVFFRQKRVSTMGPLLSPGGSSVVTLSGDVFEQMKEPCFFFCFFFFFVPVRRRLYCVCNLLSR